MKVTGCCSMCSGGQTRGELHYHTPTERWRVACPACGFWASAEKRNDAERAWLDRQERTARGELVAP